MRSNLLFAAPILALTAQAVSVSRNSVHIPAEAKRDVPGIIRYPVTAQRRGPDISKRQAGSGISNVEHGFFYTIDLVIGTPGEKVSVVFDTGSTELWVNPICAKSSQPELCAKYARYGHSSSAQALGTTANMTYGTGWAYCDGYSDFVSVGGAKVSQQIFGVAQDSSFWPMGILGAGPPANGEHSYDTVIDSLKNQGFIKSRSFGLDLQGIDSSRGSVVYGGVDLKKFRGTLERIPIIPGPSAPDRTYR
jgi:hypothetical protein